MKKNNLTPETKKKDMPKRLTAQQVQQLDGNDFYPAYFYNAALEIARHNIALLDYDKGIIDPDEVRFLGAQVWGEKRVIGNKARLRIRGREIQRIFKEGRQPRRFTGKLERLAK